MSAPVLVVKRCTACGESKPLSEFARNRRAKDGHNYECKPCARKRARAAQAKLRATLGDEAYLALRREAVRRHRERTNNARGKLYQQARSAALAELTERHQREFDALLARHLYELESVAS